IRDEREEAGMLVPRAQVGGGLGDGRQRNCRSERAVAFTHGRCLRICEDHARYRAVVGFPWLAEDVRGGDPSVVLADVCQRPDAGDIADRPDPVAGAHVPVNVYPTPIGFDANVLEPDTLQSGPTPGGNKESLPGKCGAVLE